MRSHAVLEAHHPPALHLPHPEIEHHPELACFNSSYHYSIIRVLISANLSSDLFKHNCVSISVGLLNVGFCVPDRLLEICCRSVQQALSYFSCPQHLFYTIKIAWNNNHITYLALKNESICVCKVGDPCLYYKQRPSNK